MKPTFFAKQSDFRKWLMKNHKKETELVVGFYKVDSGKPSMTWSQSVDEAICFGWIDGVRKSLGDDSYQIRFTQRKPASIWSSINIKKVEDLTKQGLMQPAGLEIFEREKGRSPEYILTRRKKRHYLLILKTYSRQRKRPGVIFNHLRLHTKIPLRIGSQAQSKKQPGLKRLNELIADCEKGTNKWKDNKYIKK
jgi:hypothetical protein